jgi:uncharacterized protein YxjI
MPRAAEASRLLLRAAAAQRAWWSAAASPPSAAAAAAAAPALFSLPPRAWSPPLATTSAAAAAASFTSEAAARARRLAAARLRRQQAHERAAARLARAAPPATSDAAPTPAQQPPSPVAPASAADADVGPGALSRGDALAVAPAVAHPALVVTRAIEWGTVVFGFEQANKYTVYDQDGRIVCLIAEDVAGLGNALGRQLLRTRRAFTATVLSPHDGSVLFRVRRPAYLISSTTYVETAQGEAVGEVRQRWHPLRRNFDLYVGREQYATISGPLLAWEFQLSDARGRTLALIDRNFQGFAKELFTDAGKYVVHFGLPAEESAAVATRTLEARSGRVGFGAVPPLQIGPGAASSAPGGGAAAASGSSSSSSDAVAVIPQVTGGQLAVARPLALDERMVALAAAVAIDFAFFSQHSHTSGMFAPPLLFPMPLPGGGGGGGVGAEAGSGEGGGGGAPVDGGGGGGAAAAGADGGEAAGGGFGGEGGGAATAASGGAGQAAGGEDGWSWDGGGGGAEGGGAAEGGGDSGWTPWGGGGDDDGGAMDDGEGGGTVGSVVRGLWRVFGDDD